MKRLGLFFFYLATFCFLYSQEVKKLDSLEEITDYILETNKDVKNAEYEYQLSTLKYKTLDGCFSPSIIFSSSSNYSGENNILEKFDSFTSTIQYGQQITSGTSVKISSNYSFYDNQNIVIKNPSLGVFLSQSLYSYWLQGKKKDPLKLSYKLKNKYYLYQLEYSKQIVLQSFIENLLSMRINLLKVKFYENQIASKEYKLALINDLIKKGSMNIVDAYNVEEDLLKNSEELLSIKSILNDNIKKLRYLYDGNIDMLKEIPINDVEYINYLNDNSVFSENWLERLYNTRIEEMKNTRVLELEKGAPLLNLGIQTTLELNRQLPNSEYSLSGNNISPTISIDLSPLINSISKKSSEQYQIQFSQLLNEYNDYKKKKDYITEYYCSLISDFKRQLDNINYILMQSEEIYEKKGLLYKNKMISEFDYIQAKNQFENVQLKNEELKLYLSFYRILQALNKDTSHN